MTLFTHTVGRALNLGLFIVYVWKDRAASSQTAPLFPKIQVGFGLRDLVL